MPEQPNQSGKVLEVVSPGRAPRFVPIDHSPFLIGRGSETGNHLQLDDRRISRRCVAIQIENGEYILEDRGHRHGIFVNGERIERRALVDGDVIHFGFEDCCEIVFRSSAGPSEIESMLTRLGNISSFSGTAAPGGLSKLNILLEATSLLHSQLPLDSVLGTMLDHAISITRADRGLLLEPDNFDSMRIRLARGAGGMSLPPEIITPSQTALRQAIERRSSVVTKDLNLADQDLQNAQSVMAQRLRSVVAIPLYTMAHVGSDEPETPSRGQLLGALYLDSRKPAAFSDLDCQILDALGVEAASILDNARLVERERERQRLEQELSIARDIQQALLPQGLCGFAHLAVTGVHSPCHEVGGDYFDVFPVSEDQTAFLIADVSGKGLGAALLTTMLQGVLSGMTLGVDPVRVFNHLNRFLCEHAEVGRYATMFFGLIDREGMLEYIAAGHPSPILLRGGEVTELFTGGSFPVGLLPDAEFTAVKRKLEPEDTLVLFSDGITEAEDPERELFGTPRLLDILAGSPKASLEALQKSILDEIGSFCNGASQSDDMTLLLVRYRTPGQDDSKVN